MIKLKIIPIFLLFSVTAISQNSAESLIPDKNIYLNVFTPVGGNYTNDHVGMNFSMSYLIGEGRYNTLLSTGSQFNRMPDGFHVGFNFTGGLAIVNPKSVFSMETGFRLHFNAPENAPLATLGFPTLKIRYSRSISDIIGLSAFYKTDGFTFQNSGYERSELGIGMYFTF